MAAEEDLSSPQFDRAQGQRDLLLPQLVQHLHCYLIKAIKSILTELDRNPTWGIRDALEHRRLLFEHVVAFFKNGNGHEISMEAILDPHACMKPQRGPFASGPSQSRPPPAAEGPDGELASPTTAPPAAAVSPVGHKRSASDCRSAGNAGWSKRIAARPAKERRTCTVLLPGRLIG